MTRNSKFYDQQVKHGYYDKLIPMRYWLPVMFTLCTVLASGAYMYGVSNG